MHRVGPRRLGALFLLAGCALARPAVAAPWRPADDAQVLETLTRTGSAQALQQAAQAADGRDFTVVSRLVRAYIERSRREGDPRLLGYAEGLLQRWPDGAGAPAEILLLRATALQSRHAFDEALDVLDRALQQQPDLGQAWLTRATILRVQGRYPQAADACEQLRDRSAPFVATLCGLGVRGLAGERDDALSGLLAIEREAAAQAPAVRRWYQAELADALERAGRMADAERAYRLGLEIDPQDVSLRAAYADLLIGQARYEDAIALTDGYVRVDVVQLRHLIAQVRLGQVPHQAIDAMDETFRLARLRGQPLHQREEVLFALDVRRDAQRALAAAQANWQEQREPIDARVLLRAALAANDATSEREALAQIGALPVQDTRLQALLATANP